MKGTAPIVTCDSEDGCTEWEIDYYEMTATNWRELMGEWKYNPYGDPNAYILCPYHAKPDPEITEECDGSASCDSLPHVEGCFATNPDFAS